LFSTEKNTCAKESNIFLLQSLPFVFVFAYELDIVNIKEDQIPHLIRQGKDKEVIPLLYKKVFPVVKKYIVSHGGEKEDAFDLFQDALIDFYGQVMKGEYKEHYKVFGYLFRFSINKWINRIKRNKRIVFKEDLSEFEGIEMKATDYTLLGKDENLLKTLFSSIGEKCIELLTYTVFYNMLMEDIAIRMSFPSASAAKMQHLRCKQKLAEEIERNPHVLKRLTER